MLDIAESAHAADLGLTWDNAFERLGGQFYTRLPPVPLHGQPYWVARSAAMACELGLADAPQVAGAYLDLLRATSLTEPGRSP